jgi:prolyl-tRNA editing enzyme YbaK/EbsC (Cys-tRNA(Pro) deacylase)
MANPDQKVLDALQKIGVPYELIEIDPESSDTKAFCERYGYPPGQTCNTILVTSKKGAKMYAACVALANTRLDVNKRVKNLLGVPKVSFASSHEMVELTGMEVGGVTPIGLPADLPLYVDQRIMNQEWVILGGGSRGLKVKVSPELFKRIGAQVVSDLAC